MKHYRFGMLLQEKKINTLKGHSGMVSSCCISRDNRFIISTSADKTLKVWDFNTGALLYDIENVYHAKIRGSKIITIDCITNKPIIININNY